MLFFLLIEDFVKVLVKDSLLGWRDGICANRGREIDFKQLVFE